jgi:ubiquitin carboxyl-terminal hydrolase 4/11/15
LKKLDVFRVPHILVIQLKRFQQQRSQFSGGMMGALGGGTKKISDLVDFPIEGLDLTKIAKGAGCGIHNAEDLLYDLYAVSNHMGSLYGGHYTAYGKNAITNKWYEFNDSSVSGTSTNHIVSSSAYLLFYRRRQS